VNEDLLSWEALAPSRRLFLAHLAGDPAARSLLGRGADDAAAAAAVEERRAIPLPHRADLARALGGYLSGLKAPPPSMLAVAKLAEAGTVAVVGGQQPAVCGGPLLAFAKAAGVVALARRLERTGAGPVVPIWWVASEDHDLAEAGAVWIDGLRRGKDLLPADFAERRMLSLVRAPSMEDIFPDGVDLSPGGGARVLFERPAEASLGTATAKLFSALFGAEGLIVVEPHVLRGFARPLFERDVREPGALAALVREGNAAVRAAGFDPVLADPGGALHFSVDDEGRRSRGGGREEDLDFLGTRLSGDVSLRVLAQDLALPPAVQVCGPTELEYLAAHGPVREGAGVFRPAALPRTGVTILERRVEEALEEFGVGLDELYREGAGVLDLPVAGGGDALAAEAGRLKAALNEAVGDRAERTSAVRSRIQRVEKALEDLEAASHRAAAEVRGLGESRRRKVLDALLPDGVPQERRWSIVPFLRRHGTGLIDRLFRALSGPEPGHRIVRPEV